MNLYKTSKWRALRRWMLAHYPVCSTKGCGRVATVVHHRKPHRFDPTNHETAGPGDEALFFDQDNLETLCKGCHDCEEQARENRGYGDRVAADGWPVDPRHVVETGREPPRRWRFGIPATIQPPVRGEVVFVHGPCRPACREFVKRAFFEGDSVADITEGARFVAPPGPRGRRVWVIADAPARGERDEWLRALGGGQVVLIETPRRECYRREPERRAAIDDWFMRFRR